MKLQSEYEKATRKKDFYFVEKKKKYTKVIINVKFSYSYKEFNKVGKNTYIRAGYDFRSCEIKDGVCIKDGKLVAIQTNVEVMDRVSDDLLGDCFAYADGYYTQVGAIHTIMSKSDLRHYLYENGFTCDGVKYVRYKRSAGSSRVGHCLFVNEIVAERMAKWDRCGLPIKQNQAIDLASWEAYIALPCSSIIDTIQIPVESILVIDDYESEFDDEVIAVEEENGELVSQKRTVKVKNSIWDGESLLDNSMFGKYSDKGMLLLRNRFFKTCAFNTNIQQWFIDNGITDVSQLNGFTLAKDISEIKLITTPSSIKYLKFGRLEDWLANVDTTFGVVKYEKETHYFDGRMVQSHYQLLNTLGLSYQNMKDLLEPSMTYIGKVRSDPDVLRYHIAYPFKIDEEEEEVNSLKSKNDIVFKLLGINNKFANTKLYNDFKKDVVKGFIRNLKQGHILINGNYSTLLGNGLEMLKAAIGMFSGESEIGTGNIHSKRFGYNETILGSRSPHVTMGNVLLVNNVANEDIDTYFNMTEQIVYVNAIGENLQQRLNGCDYDSDSILLTDNKLLIRTAQKNYDYFKVPTCFVSASKTQRFYNSAHKSDLDVRTSVNKIGEIINLSQQLNSLYWDRLNNNDKTDTLEELYSDICKLSVLSGMEIDKAKKEFIIDSGKEIDKLKRKYKLEDDSKTVKPMFFKMITTENGYELSDNVKYKNFDTSMDYLQRIIKAENTNQSKLYKTKIIPFMEIVKKPDTSIKSGYYGIQRDRVIEKIRTAKKEISRLYIDYDLKSREEKENIWNITAEIKQECVNEIDKMSENQYTMYLILKELDNEEYKDVSRFVFEVLFGKPNESFFKMIDDSKEDVYELVEGDGDIQLYDFTFTKEKISA